MHSQPSKPGQQSASRSPLVFKLLARLTDRRNTNSARAMTRARKFVAYYRPYIPLLLADLACAVLVAAGAIALPLCASYITARLRNWPRATTRSRRS